MLNRLLLTALMMGALACGLAAQEAGQEPARPAPAGKVRPKPEDKTIDPQAVLFRMGKDIYREADFQEFLPMMLTASRIEQAKRDWRMMADVRRNYADQMLLLASAKKQGLEATPEFQKRLADVTKALLVDEAKKRLPAEDSIQPTEEQIKTAYEQSKETYRIGERATARHILATVKDFDDKKAVADANDKLSKARRDLKAGKGWQEVAKKYSDDPGSRDKGGLYENFDPGAMVPEFADAVRRQKIGAMGQPVKTQFGFHMILVEGRTSPRIQTLDEVRPKVRAQVVNKLWVESWDACFDAMRKEFGYSEGDEQGIGGGK